MRLIDADALLNDMQKELEKAVSDETMTEFDCKVLMTSALALKDFVNRQPTAYDVKKAIDEIETKVYKDAVCVGCGYLKDNICTYKGSACGVSKPMLESIKRVFENIRKGGVNENNN